MQVSLTLADVGVTRHSVQRACSLSSRLTRSFCGPSSVFALLFTPLGREPLIGSAYKHENPAVAGLFLRVSDEIRTRDRRDHNPELYQLSYAHRGGV